MEKGILYVMSTAVPGLIKIGKTGIHQFENRMNYLERNGYSNVTALKREFAIEVEGYSAKEILLHTIFSKSRIAQTELFAVDIDIIIQLLSSFEGKQIYPKDRSKEEVFVEAKDKQEKEESALLPDGQYTLSRKIRTFGEVIATMEVKKGVLILKSGSICAPTKDERYESVRAKAHITNNILTEDLICSSVSTAAQVVLGNAVNGWDTWKDKKGNKIDIYRNK